MCEGRLTGKDIYEMWRQSMDSNNIGTYPYEELSEEQKAAWTFVVDSIKENGGV